MTTQQLLVPSNATLKRNVMDYSLIVVGSFLQALSYVLFLAPYKIVPGGVYGISIVIHYVTKDLFPFFPDGLPMGATALCFNIPLMILAMKKIGLSSGPKTIVTFLLISIFTDSLSYFLTDPLVENDAFIAAFYGGAILGLGVTCIFRAQSTSAGTDVLARVIANDSNLKVSNMIIVLDSAVVLCLRIGRYLCILGLLFSYMERSWRCSRRRTRTVLSLSFPERQRKCVI